VTIAFRDSTSTKIALETTKMEVSVLIDAPASHKLIVIGILLFSWIKENAQRFISGINQNSYDRNLDIQY